MFENLSPPVAMAALRFMAVFFIIVTPPPPMCVEFCGFLPAFYL